MIFIWDGLDKYRHLDTNVFLVNFIANILFLSSVECAKAVQLKSWEWDAGNHEMNINLISPAYLLLFFFFFHLIHLNSHMFALLAICGDEISAGDTKNIVVFVTFFKWTSCRNDDWNHNHWINLTKCCLSHTQEKWSSGCMYLYVTSFPAYIWFPTPSWKRQIHTLSQHQTLSSWLIRQYVF